MEEVASVDDHTPFPLHAKTLERTFKITIMYSNRVNSILEPRVPVCGGRYLVFARDRNQIVTVIV